MVIGESTPSSDDTISFSVDQIEYLRTEFERQREWVNLLASREKAVLEELERTKGSVSYRIGRMLTSIPRRLIKIVQTKDQRRTKLYVDSDEIEDEDDVFPSGIIISPDLLPTDSAMRKGDYLAEDFLILLRQGPISVNDARDMALEGSLNMTEEELHIAVEKIMQHLINSRESESIVKNMFVGLLRALVRRKNIHSIEFGERYIEALFDERAVRTLVQIHGKAGNFTRPMELLSQVTNSGWKKEQISRFKPGSDLMTKGITLKSPKNKTHSAQTGRVLYHASQSRPHTSSGYAIRTHGLVTALKQHGVDIRVMLRHGYPLDRTDFIGHSVEAMSTIDNVAYRFAPTSRSPQLLNYQDVYNFKRFEHYIDKATQSVMNEALATNASVIHSASNFVVGLAGARAAKALGIPSIYEIRGFWHLTQATKRKQYLNSDHFTLSERLEIQTASESDFVFTITQALKDILIKEGIDPSKIKVLPNAVDTDRFDAVTKDKNLARELGLDGKIIIGYIGSFVEYEGLDLLMDACAMLRKRLGDVFHLILVGDGSMMIPLRQKARFLQLEDIVTFTGRVPHEEVQRYYSLIDIAPLPRKGYRVCELVSPLKPFEAMRAGKVLVCSDVAALAEIVQDQITGVVFEKDNSEDLALIKRLIFLQS